MSSGLAKLQRLLSVALLAMVVWLVVVHRAEFAIAFEAAENAWPFFLVALLAELIYQWNRAGLYRAIYGWFGAEAPQREVTKLLLSGQAANIIVPAGGLAGLHLAERLLGRKKLSAGTFLFANALATIFDYGYLLLYFIIILFITGLGLIHLTDSVLSAGLVLLAFIFILLGILTVIFLHLRQIHSVVREVTESGKLLKPLSRLLNTNAKSFFIAFDQAWQKRRTLLKLSWHAALSAPLRLLELWTVFSLIGAPLPFPVLVIAYTICVLSMTFSITPQGLGATEAVLIALFISFGVPPGLATVGVLLYRLLTFWLPLLLGGVLFRQLKVQGA